MQQVQFGAVTKVVQGKAHQAKLKGIFSQSAEVKRLDKNFQAYEQKLRQDNHHDPNYHVISLYLKPDERLVIDGPEYSAFAIDVLRMIQRVLDKPFSWREILTNDFQGPSAIEIVESEALKAKYKRQVTSMLDLDA